MSRPLLPRRTLSLSLAAAVVGGGLVGVSSAASSPASGGEPPRPRSAVAAAEVGRAPLPVGSSVRGRAGLEATALELAAALDAVPVRADGDEATRYCAPDRLRVRWTAPAPGEYELGGHVDPVGPAPADDATAANGLVVCEGASYAYLGFEARWSGASWDVAAVPALSDEHDLHEEEERAEEDHEAEPPVVRPARPARPSAPRPAPGFSVPSAGGIDAYAAYDPQRTCDPVAKPGTVALRDLLLRTHPGTRSLGVSRTCTARGVSEHKEGRAFDWGVDKGVPAERAAAESVLTQLLATDEAGHPHALARRLGVMYLIWDRQIWSAYNRSWKPYSGASPHTDHVHISLSWAGAMGRTSYWSGANAGLLRYDPSLRLVTGPGGADPVLAAPAVRGGDAPVGEEDQTREERRKSKAVRRAEEAAREAERTAPPTDAAPPAVPTEPVDGDRGGKGGDKDKRKGKGAGQHDPVVVTAVAPPVEVQAPAPKPVKAPPQPVKAPRTEAPQAAKASKTARPVKSAQAVRSSKATQPPKAPRTPKAPASGGKGGGGGKGKG